MPEIGAVTVMLKAQDEVSGVIGQIQGAIGGITGIMSKMGGVMGDVGNIIGSAFSGFATGRAAGAALGAGTAALGAVVEGIQACVKEATASEAVWASLGPQSSGSSDDIARGKEAEETGKISPQILRTKTKCQISADSPDEL